MNASDEARVRKLATFFKAIRQVSARCSWIGIGAAGREYYEIRFLQF